MPILQHPSISGSLGATCCILPLLHTSGGAQPVQDTELLLPHMSPPSTVPFLPASHSAVLQARSRVTPGTGTCTGPVTSCINSSFLLHLPESLFENNPAQCGRDGRRAGRLCFFSSSVEKHEKILLCQSARS